MSIDLCPALVSMTAELEKCDVVRVKEILFAALRWSDDHSLTPESRKGAGHVIELARLELSVRRRPPTSEKQAQLIARLRETLPPSMRTIAAGIQARDQPSQEKTNRQVGSTEEDA